MQRRGDNSRSPSDRSYDGRATSSGRSLQSSREISATSDFKKYQQQRYAEIDHKIINGECLTHEDRMLHIARLSSQHSFGDFDTIGRSQGNTTEFNSETEGYNSSRGYGTSSRDLEYTAFGSGLHGGLGDGGEFSPAHYSEVTRGRGDGQSTTFDSSAGRGFNNRREYENYSGIGGNMGYDTSTRYSRSHDDLVDSELRGGTRGTTSDGPAAMRYSGTSGNDSDIRWAQENMVETTHSRDMPGPKTEIDIQAVPYNKKGTEQSSDYDRRRQALEQERIKHRIKDRKSLERGRRGGQTAIAIDGKQGSRDRRRETTTRGDQSRRSRSRDTGRSIRSGTDARKFALEQAGEQPYRDTNKKSAGKRLKKGLKITTKALLHTAAWTVCFMPGSCFSCYFLHKDYKKYQSVKQKDLEIAK